MKHLLAFVLLPSCIAFSQNATTSDATGSVDKGKKIFMDVGCYECHGTVGQGGAAGARIGPPPLNAQGFIRYIRKPAGAMPAFTDKVLTDRDLTDVYAYLKSIPAPKPVKDIPILNELKGK